MTSDKSSQDRLSQNEHSQDRLLRPASMAYLYRFLGGAVLGAVMVAVPYSVASIPVDSLHIGVAIGFVLVCGTLASRFGPNFIETVSKILADTGLY